MLAAKVVAPQSHSTLLVNFAPQRQPCLHVLSNSASRKAGKLQGPKVPKTGIEGAHDVQGLIGRIEVIAASLITLPKPIITRSGGWVRPETWTMAISGLPSLTPLLLSFEC